MNDEQPGTDEAQIRQQIEGFIKALRAKDLDGLMSHYAENVVVFDVPPPLQYEGTTSYRKNWAHWFASFQGPAIGYEIRDMSITAGGEVAFSRSVNRITGVRTNGENTDVWVRVTVCFRKITGAWLVTHEHVSVPINMQTYQAALDLKP